MKIRDNIYIACGCLHMRFGNYFNLSASKEAGYFRLESGRDMFAVELEWDSCMKKRLEWEYSAYMGRFSFGLFGFDLLIDLPRFLSDKDFVETDTEKKISNITIPIFEKVERYMGN